MIKPDWNKFKAKFSDNPQNSFEWFCYLLFCQEFNKPAGIFRYKNQSGIETTPITKDSEVIGWQRRAFKKTSRGSEPKTNTGHKRNRRRWKDSGYKETV